MNPWGTGLVYSTYLGGSGIDQESYAEGIAIDGAGNAYVTGSTTADNFPTTAGVIQPKAGYPLCYYEVCTDAFVTKLNAAGSALVYSTYLMGEAQDFANGIAVDSAGNAYVAGGTASRLLPGRQRVAAQGRLVPGCVRRQAERQRLATRSIRPIWAGRVRVTRSRGPRARWPSPSTLGQGACDRA